MEDLTNLYNEVISTPEFKNFLMKLGGEVISSRTQIKRCNIRILVQPSGYSKIIEWILLSGGVVRSMSSTADRYSKYHEMTQWPSKPSVSDMLRTITVVEGYYEKLDAIYNSRIENLKSKKDLVLALIFDHELYTYGDNTKIWDYTKNGFRSFIDHTYYTLFGAGRSYNGNIRRK